MEWKLWYYNGSTFSSEDGSWADAPYWGVVCLVTADPDVGRELDLGERGEGFAWWPGASKPWGFDRTGLLDYLVAMGWPETARLADMSMTDWRLAGVKLGRSVDNDVFRHILEQATTDPDFPPKSARTPREIREMP